MALGKLFGIPIPIIVVVFLVLTYFIFTYFMKKDSDDDSNLITPKVYQINNGSSKPLTVSYSAYAKSVPNKDSDKLTFDSINLLYFNKKLVPPGMMVFQSDEDPSFVLNGEEYTLNQEQLTVVNSDDVVRVIDIPVESQNLDPSNNWYSILNNSTSDICIPATYTLIANFNNPLPSCTPPRVMVDNKVYRIPLSKKTMDISQTSKVTIS